MNITRALIEIRKTKRLVDFYNYLISSASSEGESWRFDNRRTTDTIKKIIYPSISLNSLRKTRDEYEAKLGELQAKIKKANWKGTEPITAVLDEVDDINKKITRKVESATEGIRVYEDEVDNIEDVGQLIEDVLSYHEKLAELSYKIQERNFKTEI